MAETLASLEAKEEEEILLVQETAMNTVIKSAGQCTHGGIANRRYVGELKDLAETVLRSKKR
eukprot:1922972-Karenia_brevis.AAC.1